ncbi:MAG: hypothetical protein JSV91_01490 [Phycisphaerales bacterium]|nr:MAG: hypothetical protein JSV91_01490 [Phycisphaerales bacterium]
MAKTKVLICPYCGDSQPAADRCRACGGLLDPLSRQATHNEMGPWFIRDPGRSFQPGCSYETLVKLIDRERVNKNTIIRGPTTRQFWNAAKRVPGVAHLLGYCHNCDAMVEPTDHGCHACGVPFGAYLHRNYLGLPDIQPLPDDPDGASGAESAGRPIPEPLSPPLPVPELGASGISSFASDDELLARSPISGASAVTTGSGFDRTGPAGDSPSLSRSEGSFLSASQPPSPVSGLAGPHSASRYANYSEPSPQPAVQDWATSPVARAMQRKLARHQRTIRVMGIGLIAIATVAVVVSVTSILTLAGASGRSGKGAPIIPGQTSGGERGNAESTPDQPALFAPRQPPPGESASVEDEGAAIRGSGESGREDATGTMPPDGTFEQEPFESDLAEAEELVERASDAQRPAADRLADYRRALALLEAVAAQTPPEQQPADLPQRIERVRQAIDRLEVDSFFNGE